MKQTTIYIENEKLDLYEDENIIVNSSVQNINDISKVFTDFSESFTVPASQNNNRIFKHYYNADISNRFDARTKKNGKIEINSIPFREGKIRLEGVELKNGKPDNYKITFFGNLVSLSELFGEDTLQSLGVDAYNHDYDAGTVRTGFDNANYDNGITNTGLFFENLVYVPLSPKRRFLYDGSTTDTETTLNVANRPIKVQDLTLGIRINTLFSLIQSKYGITFSDDVINPTSGLLNKMYMSVDKLVTHSESDINLNANYTQRVDMEQGGGREGTTYQLHSVRITPNPGFEDVNYTILIHDTTNNEWTEKTQSGYGGFGIALRGEDAPTLPYERDIKFYMNADEDFQFTGEVWKTETRYIDTGQGSPQRSHTSTKLKNLSATSVSVSVSMKESMPTLKVKDFVTGIINALNLVVIPTSDTEYYVHLLDSWYAEGQTHDITKYTSIENVSISNQEYLSEINFEYEEPSTLLALDFYNRNSRYFGNLNYVVRDEQGEKIDGNDFEIKLPFEQIIYERLFDNDTGALTNFQYGFKVNEDMEPTDTKPILFFSQRTQLGDYPIQIDNGAGGTKEVTRCNIAHYVERNSFKQSLTFGEEQDSYTGGLITKSLYDVFYSDYITDIFSAKRRVYNYTTKLPEQLLTKIKLNDKIVIEGTRYIINNMQINLTTNITELELLNDIY